MVPYNTLVNNYLSLLQSNILFVRFGDNIRLVFMSKKPHYPKKFCNGRVDLDVPLFEE